VDTAAKRRRRWAIEIKRRIVEESLEGTGSVAQLAQKYAVNANQIFKWRKDYREERLENSNSINLLPVTVSKEVVVEAANPRNSSYQAAGSLQIELPKGNLRIAGSVDLTVLRTALECLLG
jgi:transposase